MQVGASMTHNNNHSQDNTPTVTGPNSTQNRMSSSRHEDREPGIPLLSRLGTREHSSAFTDQNPPSYVEYLREITSEPNVMRWHPRLTDQTQAATDSTDPVNEMFLQAVVNMQPRSRSTQSQQSQTTV